MGKDSIIKKGTFQPFTRKKSKDGKRVHFASAMTLLGLSDGDNATTNHGFLLTPKGWTLSPAFDINPSLSEYQSLLISSNSNKADLNILLNACEDYMIKRNIAEQIISEVANAVKDWRKLAAQLKISKREMDIFSGVFDESPTTLV